jgi:xanthine dehydrogenase YagS FAD-binding subunit
MHPFKYTRVSSTREALAATGTHSRFLAGGTNLLDLMKLNVEVPNQLIDINDLDLNKIEVFPGGSIRVGALVKNTDLAYHPMVMQRFPVLSEAILVGASAQLRNAASTAGNIMQRVRCPYFYDTAFPCNKREPGTGCSAIPGYNREHAVLGTSEYCIATHPSDMAVAMAALDAVIHIQGPKGLRNVRFVDFHLLPGKTPHVEHNLKNGEIITAVELPALSYGAKSHYVKTRDRASYQFALASAAVALDIQAGTIKAARVALGGVGTKPWRSVEAEQVLIGNAAGASAYQAAAEAALAGAKAYKDNGFKIGLAKSTLVRALTEIGGIV